MPKYYISCGTLKYISSTKKDAAGAAIDSTFQLNDFDTLDEYFYIDERGYRDYATANPDTIVIPTDEIISEEGWTQI